MILVICSKARSTLGVKLVQQKASQQSVQRTAGSLRRFQASSTLQVFSVRRSWFSPAAR